MHRKISDMSKRKPSPELLQFPIFMDHIPRVKKSKQLPREWKSGKWQIKSRGYRVGIKHKKLIISTPWYKTERGARNAWNRMAKIARKRLGRPRKR